jgi:hypothetical protein
VDAGQAVELGLQLRQQIGTKESVIDGYLYQDAFRIAIETKRSADGFDVRQLLRHLSGFNSGEEGFLILLSPEPAQITPADYRDLSIRASKKNVIVIVLTFEKIIEPARNSLSPHDEEMHALVVDYESFCSDEKLLPLDKWTIFVPPCGRSHEINISGKLYFCPDSWSRRKAQYLGIYFDKAVHYVGEIKKVVQCKIDKENMVAETVKLTNIEKKRIVGAGKRASKEQGWDLRSGRQFFLCDEMFKTSFKKSSPGGIMGHRYFDLRDYVNSKTPLQLADLAQRLEGAEWK